MSKSQIAGLKCLPLSTDLTTVSQTRCIVIACVSNAPDNGRVKRDSKPQGDQRDPFALPLKPADTITCKPEGLELLENPCGQGGRWGSSRVATSVLADYSL